jgi:hypothetical protein
VVLEDVRGGGREHLGRAGEDLDGVEVGQAEEGFSEEDEGGGHLGLGDRPLAAGRYRDVHYPASLVSAKSAPKDITEKQGLIK